MRMITSTKVADTSLPHAWTLPGATDVSATLGFNLVAFRGEIGASLASDRRGAADVPGNLVGTPVKRARRQPTLLRFDDL